MPERCLLNHRRQMTYQDSTTWTYRRATPSRSCCATFTFGLAIQSTLKTSPVQSISQPESRRTQTPLALLKAWMFSLPPDDLDGGVNTSLDAEDMTPTTSRPTDGLTVKDTPSRPFSRESNHVFSTAPDQPSPDSVGDAKYADSSTPAARAGAKRGKRAKLNMNSSEDGDS
jgi:hypothetical protein